MTRWRGVVILVVGALAIATVLLFPGRPDQITLVEPVRVKLADGLELVQATLYRGPRAAGQMVAVYASLDRVRPRLRLNPERLPLAGLAEGALLVTNAGFFTEEWKATGLLVSSGKTLSPFVPQAGSAGSGVFLIRAGQIRLLERDAARGETFSDALLAIQAGPRIIEPGGRPGIRSDDGARANRTVIGADHAGRLALVVVYQGDGGHRFGPSLFELMRLLGSQGLGRVSRELALDIALNLDGGASTGLSLRSQAHGTHLPEQNRVFSVLSLSPHHP